MANNRLFIYFASIITSIVKAAGDTNIFDLCRVFDVWNVWP
jgi:hypothetical protein